VQAYLTKTLVILKILQLVVGRGLLGGMVVRSGLMVEEQGRLLEMNSERAW
jgi:hypothetical protein